MALSSPEEIDGDRLFAGLMRLFQHRHGCPATGEPCKPVGCACAWNLKLEWLATEKRWAKIAPV